MLRRANASNCRVLLIDTDSQGHASLVTTGRKDYGADDSLYTVLMADRQNAPQTLMNCIVPSQWDEDLHVLPASPMLEGAERELMGVAGAPYRLADPLSKIERWHRSLKNVICLENYYLPGELDQAIAAFVEHCNQQRYPETLDNLTPADVFFGRTAQVLDARAAVKQRTLAQRRAQQLSRVGNSSGLLPEHRSP